MRLADIPILLYRGSRQLTEFRLTDILQFSTRCSVSSDLRKLNREIPIPGVDAQLRRLGIDNLQREIESSYDHKIAKILIQILRTYFGLASGVLTFGDWYEFCGRMSSWILLVSEPMFPGQKRLELSSQKPFKPYRDHLLHPAVVFTLGYSLLSRKFGKSRDLWTTLAESTSESEASRVAKILANGRRDNRNDLNWKRVIGSAWCLAALTHDIAYAIEPSKHLASFFARAGSRGAGRECVLGTAAVASLVQVCPKKSAWFKIIDNWFDHGADLNHGQIAAALLLKNYIGSPDYERLSLEEKVALYLAAELMCFHDELTKEDVIPSDPRYKERSPFFWFFCLVDLISEIRIIWSHAQATSKGTWGSEWKFSTWIPFDQINISPARGKIRKITFSRMQPIPKDVVTSSGFDYKKATGSKTKKAQLERLLREIDLLGPSKLEIGLLPND